MEELGGKGREEGRGEGVGGAIQCLASGRHRLSCATAIHNPNTNPDLTLSQSLTITQNNSLT